VVNEYPHTCEKEGCGQYIPPEELRVTRYEVEKTIEHGARVRIMFTHRNCEPPHEIPPEKQL
ncbi:MAG: hypothetical protein WCY05_06470, partial [Candidatus Omnitrophota bacterium]